MSPGRTFVFLAEGVELISNILPFIAVPVIYGVTTVPLGRK